jgi:SPP1 gp7 family putative phage head morphogenesis protein
MKKETFPGYQLITFDDGTYGYVMADGKSKNGYKSKQGAKNAAKKLATALQVMPYTLTDIEQALADELSALYDDAAKYLVDKAKNFVSKYQPGKQYDADALNALIKQLTDQIAKTNADAVAAINGYAPLVAAEQANFTEYAIEDGTTLNPSFTLLNQDTVLRLIKDSPAVLPKAKAKIAKNKQWNTPKLRSALTHAIVQGDSIPKLSKKVEEICGSNKAIATRNARTMMTGARNAGTLAAYVRAEQNGMHIQKQWMAALDERTRVSHRHLDGEIKPVNEKFSNGLMHPGDTTGRPAEVWNCRCTMVPIVNDQLYEGKRANKLNDMSYEEWRNAQPKPKSKAKKKKKTAGNDAKSNTNETHKSETTEIPDNKASLIAAFEKAKADATADHGKLDDYRQAAKALSEGIEFGDTFQALIGKKHVVKMQELLDAAQSEHPEIVEMYRAWQSQFNFEQIDKDGAYYFSYDRKVHINLKDVVDENAYSAEYNTLFHELAHLIDNCCDSPGNEFNYISKNLTSRIKDDWTIYRDKMMREFLEDDDIDWASEDQRNQYAVQYMQQIACAKPGEDPHYTYWQGYAYDKRAWADVSDIVEGCTGIDFPFGCGHGAKYHQDLEGKTAREFFAETCAAAITCPESFAKISEVFPSSVKLLVDIVKDVIR